MTTRTAVSCQLYVICISRGDSKGCFNKKEEFQWVEEESKIRNLQIVVAENETSLKEMLK